MSRPCFLGVERSVSGKRWEHRCPDTRAGLYLSQRLNVSEVLGQVLVGRDIGLDQASVFLEPSLKDHMPNPSILKDMDLATKIAVQAIKSGEKIALFGDYDVDGISATSMMVRYLSAIGTEYQTYIPDRQSEGYGPNAPAMQSLWDQECRTLITIDCGISAFEALERAETLGFQTLVLDHHKAEAQLPQAKAIVNPNRLDDESGLGYLCAAGVVFLFLVSLQRELREAGFFEKTAVPDLRWALDLAALATVCDVVPLQGFNRLLVKQGLKVLAKRQNVGLDALLDVSKLHEGINASTLGFQLGPRINAAGRVSSALDGVTLLTTSEAQTARRIAFDLDEKNNQRKALEAGMIEQALLQAQAQAEQQRFIIVHQEGWHEGVIGIVAGRLKERFFRPTLVIAWNGDHGKGSARSIPGFDLGAFVLAARKNGLISSGGGHTMAAGLSLTKDQLPALIEFAQEWSAKITNYDLVPRLGVDALVSLQAANKVLIEEVAKAAPYGQANPEPRFAFQDVMVKSLTEVGAGKEHLRLSFTDASGATLKAMAFRASGTELGQYLKNAKTGKKSLKIAGHLRPDAWSGPNSVQLLLDDLV